MRSWWKVSKRGRANRRQTSLTQAYINLFPATTSASIPAVITLRSSWNVYESWVLCYDRRSAGQSVLEQSAHLGLTTRSLLHVWQLRSCFFGAPSLTRSRVCPLYMLLVLASAVFLGS
jgi:hypothetical protein